jgi:hypothetical protein
MRDRPVTRVEDYTRTCLVLFFVNLFWVLVVVMAIFGWPAVLVIAVALHAAIGRLGRRREADAAPVLRD